jgi:hypothetical protein
MLHRFAFAAALLLATSAQGADSFTLNMAGDRFASVHLMVKVTAPNRAAYLQEGSQYKVAPEWQHVDSILCDQTTREMEVWVNPAATPRGGKMLVEFALVMNNQPVAQTAIERDMAGGTGKGFTHLVDRDFILVINRTCR